MKLHFMCLSRNEQHLDGLFRNLHVNDNDVSIEALRGAKSITEGYNKLAQSAPKDAGIYCFIHEDARLHFDYKTIIPQYYTGLAERAGVLGFIGCKRIGCDSRWWIGQPHYGSLIQFDYPASSEPNFRCLEPRYRIDPNLCCEEVDSVDGYCLIIRRNVFELVGGFDEHFDHFHCYDSDLCLTAIKCGYRNFVIAQKSQHFSGGSLAGLWSRENEKFISKWTPFIRSRA